MTKFHNDWAKIADFLIKVYFCMVSLINEQFLVYIKSDFKGGL